MDPNVQVALVGVFATTITTMGVIFVAMINNRKERGKAAEAGVDAALDERDILERLLGLITENQRKEAHIQQLQAERNALLVENQTLKAKLEGGT
jgi:hypothetical protein